MTEIQQVIQTLPIDDEVVEFTMIGKKKKEKTDKIQVKQLTQNSIKFFSPLGVMSIKDNRPLSAILPGYKTENITIKEFLSTLKIKDISMILDSKSNHQVYTFIQNLFTLQAYKIMNRSHQMFEFIADFDIQQVSIIFNDVTNPYHPLIKGLKPENIENIFRNSKHPLYSCIERDDWGLKFTFPKTEVVFRTGKMPLKIWSKHD